MSTPLHEPGEALIGVLDHFLEVAFLARKQRRLAKLVKKHAPVFAKVFRAQGRDFVKGFAQFKASFKEAGRPVARSSGPFLVLRDGQVREAGLELGGDAWLTVWDTVAKKHAQAFVAAIEACAAEGFLAGAEDLIADAGVDISFSLANPRAEAYLQNYGAAMVRKIDDTTRAEIKSIVERAMREGWSYNRTAKEITARFAQFAVGMPQQHIKSRAHLVAVTEAGNAYCAGNLAVANGMAEDYGWEMEKSWLTSQDSRVSAGCRTNAAAGWIALAGKFPSGHDRPLRFPGCRCDLLIRRKGGWKHTTD